MLCVSYKVEFSKGASKQFAKLSDELQKRIQNKIDQLVDNPRPDGVAKLKNAENRYRIKIGVYRVLYNILDDILLVTVVKVGHRSKVYDDE
jgi:mRNA interferase RelE/StbE